MCVFRYREMLSVVECVSTQSLRLTLTMQLAEVLLRGVTGQVCIFFYIRSCFCKIRGFHYGSYFFFIPFFLIVTQHLIVSI